MRTLFLLFISLSCFAQGVHHKTTGNIVSIDTVLTTTRFNQLIIPNTFYCNPNFDSTNSIAIVDGVLYYNDGLGGWIAFGGGGGATYYASGYLGLTISNRFYADTTSGKLATKTDLQSYFIRIDSNTHKNSITYDYYWNNYPLLDVYATLTDLSDTSTSLRNWANGRFSVTLKVNPNQVLFGNIDSSITSSSSLIYSNSRGLILSDKNFGILNNTGSETYLSGNGYWQVQSGDSLVGIYSQVETGGGYSIIGFFSLTGETDITRENNGYLTIDNGLNVSGQIKNVSSPTLSGDATNKSYVDSVSSIYNYFGTIILSGDSVKIDTTLICTKLWRQKAIDSLNLVMQLKLSGSGIVKSSSGIISYISGTSSQFIMGDGSLNGSTYLTSAITSIKYLSPLTGGTITGVGTVSIPASTSTTDGYLSQGDWSSFNNKQAALSGTGFVKVAGLVISYDGNTYLTTSSASSTYSLISNPTFIGIVTTPSLTVTSSISTPAGLLHGYISSTVITTAGTYTLNPPTGTKLIRVQIVGGGGGSGGAHPSGAVVVCSGGGGSGSLALYDSYSWSTVVLTVGSAGSAGSATGVNSVSPTTGGTGGNTTFSDGFVTVTANGGIGSLGNVQSAAVYNSAGGAKGAISTNGTANCSGLNGGYAISQSSLFFHSGDGAPSPLFGGGGQGITNVANTAANPGDVPGAGAGGPITASGSANIKDGGVGAAGGAIITYYN